jgi:hypothetical protein
LLSRRRVSPVEPLLLWQSVQPYVDRLA